MRLTKSVGVGLGIVAVCLGLTACDEEDGPTSWGPIESTAAPGSTTPTPSEATTADYHIKLDVAYRETLRYPGAGHLPRELDVSYHIDEPAATGASVDADAHGQVDWSIRCFVGDATADPESEPASWEREVHPFAPPGTLDLLPDQAEREPGIDWLAGPGIVVLEVGDELWIAHRLPSAVALNKAVRNECGDPVLALIVSWGHGAMTAPARVNVGGTDYSHAEALNQEAASPVYLLDPAGDGWLLTKVPLDDFAAGPVEIDYLREESEPEGERRLVVTGTIERLG